MDLIAAWGPVALALSAMGALTGFFAGMLGIGGGLILVPGLYFGLAALGYGGAHAMHLAVGTALATILPTGLSSARAHWRRGAVDWALWRRLAPGALAGALAGVAAASVADTAALRTIFGLTVAGVAALMFIDPARYRAPPPGPWITAAGAGVGLLAALMGLGGALLIVPLLVASGVRMHSAVGTGAATNPAISAPATLGFIAIGWGAATGVPGALGYVCLPAWAVIAPFSVLAAPLGARAAHALDTAPLRRAFAVFMLAIAGRMLWGA
jgi:uncharacterized membrane protein YfcA